jgi:hypothetical protein
MCVRVIFCLSGKKQRAAFLLFWWEVYCGRTGLDWIGRFAECPGHSHVSARSAVAVWLSFVNYCFFSPFFFCCFCLLCYPTQARPCKRRNNRSPRSPPLYGLKSAFFPKERLFCDPISRHNFLAVAIEWLPGPCPSPRQHAGAMDSGVWCSSQSRLWREGFG